MLQPKCFRMGFAAIFEKHLLLYLCVYCVFNKHVPANVFERHAEVATREEKPANPLFIVGRVSFSLDYCTTPYDTK